MKQLLITAVCLALMQNGFAQVRLPKNITQQSSRIPSGKLPDLKVKPLTQTDLSVSGLRVISMVNDEESGTYKLRIAYTIKNNGGLATNAANRASFQVMCYLSYEVIMPMYLPHDGILQPGIPALPWKFATEVNVINETIASNSSLAVEQELVLNPAPENKAKKFWLVAGADLYNESNESKRDNNFSNIILVTPPNH